MAAGSAFSSAVATESPATESVTDRTSSIRINKLVPHIFRDRVFVEINTNHGIQGWGEIKGVVPTVAAALAKSMFELLDGQNPTRTEHLWQALYRAARAARWCRRPLLAGP